MTGKSRFRNAVTLLEVVLAMSILVPMIGTMFWFYSSALESRERSAAVIRDVQLARVVLDRIVNELRQATGFAAGYGIGVFGTRHQISINTVTIPDKALVERRGKRESRKPGQFDLRQVDYYVAWDDVNTDENGDPRSLGLVRRERRTFNKLDPLEAAAVAGQADGTQSAPGDANDRAGSGPQPGRSADSVLDDDASGELQDKELEGSKRELYAPEIKFVEFFYHDGNRWWDTWELGKGNTLPQMVMVTVGYVPELPEEAEIKISKDLLADEEDIEPIPRDRYVAVVRIPQADTFFGSRVQREVSALSDLADLQ